MKNLPIGEQNFQKIREKDFLYVDKTEHIYRLVTTASYYFLSRPRRFGKSLTLSTIEELFKGKRALFEGLWIENHWDWTQTNPVIHIAFNKIGYLEIGLENALVKALREQAEAQGISLENETPGLMLAELVSKLAQAQAPVVLLIDEYDKPIIDYLEKEDLPTAKAHRKILKAFYAGMKDSKSQAALRLFLITGVSKFSQVSVFSDLNYLDDITMDNFFAALTGYTQTELESFFAEWLEMMLQAFPNFDRKQLLAEIKTWYNGYSWNAETLVYNPFSILNLFKKRSFEDYWFKSGTPTFLLHLLKEKRIFKLDQLRVNKSLFDSYDLENMDARSLLFQTGYLTIKAIDRKTGIYTLGYPNREVEEAMHNHLIATLLQSQPGDSTEPVLQLRDAFCENDPKRVVAIINAMLKDVPSHIIHGKDEHFYHALVHLHFRYLGLFMDSEVHTSDGRMDAVVQTPTHVFVLEFKLDESAKIALQQIREKGYAEKFRLAQKTMVGLGINFNSEKKAVDDWVAEGIE